jgi:hypothetical protein
VIQHLRIASAISFILTMPLATITTPLMAKDLADLIPGLYGGDGVQLAKTYEGQPAHSNVFKVDSAAKIYKFNQEISSEVRPLPIAPSAGGITYEFDPEKGTYRRTTESLGPIVAARPQTLGKGKFSVNVAFTSFEYDKFEGDNLNNIKATAVHEDFPNAAGKLPSPGDPPFELDTVEVKLDVDLKFRSLALAGTYGITDRLDIGAVIPVVDAEMDVHADARVIHSPLNKTPDLHTFEGEDAESPKDFARGSATGIGDILLRAKYYGINRRHFGLAGAFEVKLPTGDENDFLGTGDTTVLPFLIASGTFANILIPHLNLGYEFNLDDSDKDAVAYAVGLEVGKPILTGVIDVLGHHELNGDDIGSDIVNAAFGIKWSPANRIILIANGMIPINNDEGLRSDFIGTVGLEYRM